mmetsp:Transcript_8218/g.21532  ORF Transcript_8218/g.21532 Transcript_8218/m.21532 type:complete len:232 (+) Transcript_8218:1212-1907(+)
MSEHEAHAAAHGLPQLLGEGGAVAAARTAQRAGVGAGGGRGRGGGGLGNVVGGGGGRRCPRACVEVDEHAVAPVEMGEIVRPVHLDLDGVLELRHQLARATIVRAAVELIALAVEARDLQQIRHRRLARELALQINPRTLRRGGRGVPRAAAPQLGLLAVHAATTGKEHTLGDQPHRHVLKGAEPDPLDWRVREERGGHLGTLRLRCRAIIFSRRRAIFDRRRAAQLRAVL